MPVYRRLDWRYVLGLWLVVAVALVLHAYAAVADEVGRWTLRDHAFTWVSYFYRGLLWAALTPAIFALRREIARRHRHPLVIGGLHFLAALALGLWANVVRIWALNITFGYYTLEDLALDMVYSELGFRSVIDFYFYWAVLTAARLLDLHALQREAALREEQLRTQLVQAELSALKQQVQPHFLFNSLNAISALMREGEAARAVEALALLSSLLRQLMNQAGKPEIELWRELDYAQCYLSVEKVRFEERLIAQFDAEDDCLHALVPTLILQPLVENAVKHGIAQRRNPGRIAVTACRTGEWLRLQVRNDPAEGGRRGTEGDSHGIGLRATRARLERTFGERHRLDCALDGPDGTLITLELPWRLAAEN